MMGKNFVESMAQKGTFRLIINLKRNTPDKGLISPPLPILSRN